MNELWEVKETFGGYIVVGPNNKEIIWQDGPYGTPTISLKNASLIAATPNMLKALRIAFEVMKNVDGENDCSRGINAIEEAIYAATGENIT